MKDIEILREILNVFDKDKDRDIINELSKRSLYPIDSLNYEQLSMVEEILKLLSNHSDADLKYNDFEVFNTIESQRLEQLYSKYQHNLDKYKTTTNSITSKNVKKSNKSITIIATIIIFLIATFIYVRLTITNDIENNLQKRPSVLVQNIKKIEEYYKKKFPEFSKKVSQLSLKNNELIKAEIDRQVDMAFKPVYGAVDNFVKFHYSLWGEYAEISTAMFGNLSSSIEDKLFNSVNFDKRLDETFKNINSYGLNIIDKQRGDIKTLAQDDFALNDEQSEAYLNNALGLSINEVSKRNKNTWLKFGLHGTLGAVALTGIAAKTGVGKAATGKLSSMIARNIAIKAGTKAAIKTGAKATSIAAGAITGLSIGAAAGTICGPLAVVCSPAAATTLFAVGWIATDKVVLEIDKHFTKEDFHNDLIQSIDEEKADVKKELYTTYSKSLNQYSQSINASIASAKNIPIKDIIENRHSNIIFSDLSTAQKTTYITNMLREYGYISVSNRSDNIVIYLKNISYNKNKFNDKNIGAIYFTASATMNVDVGNMVTNFDNNTDRLIISVSEPTIELSTVPSSLIIAPVSRTIKNNNGDYKKNLEFILDYEDVTREVGKLALDTFAHNVKLDDKMATKESFKKMMKEYYKSTGAEVVINWKVTTNTNHEKSIIDKLTTYNITTDDNKNSLYYFDFGYQPHYSEDKKQVIYSPAYSNNEYKKRLQKSVHTK